MIVSGVPKMKTGEEFRRENWASQESYYIEVDIVPFTHKENVRGGEGGRRHISKTELDKSVLRAWNMELFSFGVLLYSKGGFWSSYSSSSLK